MFALCMAPFRCLYFDCVLTGLNFSRYMYSLVGASIGCDVQVLANRGSKFTPIAD